MSVVPLVIPCFNEALRLPVQQFLSDLREQPELHLLFVNDGSTDATIEVLQKLVDAFPERVKNLSLPRNQGKAEAVRAGMLKAHTTWPSAAYIGFFDADLATPLDEAQRLLRSVAPRHPAMLIGSRVNLYGTTRIQRSNMRHYVGRLSATMVSMSLGLGVYDTQCGAKLFRSDVIPQLFDKPFISRWLFDVELIWRLLIVMGRERMPHELAEVPVSQWDERGGSKVRFSDGLRVPFALWRIRRAYSGRVR